MKTEDRRQEIGEERLKAEGRRTRRENTEDRRQESGEKQRIKAKG
jgi:hypothetical protein